MSTFLDPYELAAMQAEMVSSFPSTATVKRNTQAPDGLGAQTDSWNTLASYACELVEERGPGEITEGDKPTSITMWLARLPVGANVNVKDRLVIDGRTYEVNDTDAGRANALRLSCTCRRLDG